MGLLPMRRTDVTMDQMNQINQMNQMNQMVPNSAHGVPSGPQAALCGLGLGLGIGIGLSLGHCLGRGRQW